MTQRVIGHPKLYVRYESNQPLWAWADDEVENRARRYVHLLKNSNQDIVVLVSNELSVVAFRVLVKEQVISHEHIIFMHNGKEYHVNEDGRFNAPYPITSRLEQLLMRLI